MSEENGTKSHGHSHGNDRVLSDPARATLADAVARFEDAVRRDDRFARAGLEICARPGWSERDRQLTDQLRATRLALIGLLPNPQSSDSGRAALMARLWKAASQCTARDLETLADTAEIMAGRAAASA